MMWFVDGVGWIPNSSLYTWQGSWEVAKTKAACAHLDTLILLNSLFFTVFLAMKEGGKKFFPSAI